MLAMSLDRAAALWAEKSNLPRPHRATLMRWATKGVRGARLHAQRRGGRWFVTDEALSEFHRLVNADTGSPIPRAAGPVRGAEIELAHAKLSKKICGRRAAAAHA